FTISQVPLPAPLFMVTSAGNCGGTAPAVMCKKGKRRQKITAQTLCFHWSFPIFIRVCCALHFCSSIVPIVESLASFLSVIRDFKTDAIRVGKEKSVIIESILRVKLRRGTIDSC